MNSKPAVGTGPAHKLGAVPVGLILFMLALHVINQIDRQLVTAFAADIMHDLELNRSQFALIAGLAFSGVYAVAALVAGVKADRIGRVRVLAIGSTMSWTWGPCWERTCWHFSRSPLHFWPCAVRGKSTDAVPRRSAT